MAGTANKQSGAARAGDATLRRLIARLRELRMASGLTQERFSESAGISYKYYQAVEAGRKRELRLSTLERLARAHHMEVWQLLAPTELKADSSKLTKRTRKQGR